MGLFIILMIIWGLLGFIISVANAHKCDAFYESMINPYKKCLFIFVQGPLIIIFQGIYVAVEEFNKRYVPIIKVKYNLLLEWLKN